MLRAMVLTSSALDGAVGTTHSTTMDRTAEDQPSCVSTVRLLNSDLHTDSALDQVCQEVDLSLAPLACGNRDHQGKFDLFLALSQSVFDPVEDRLCRNHKGDELFRFDLVEGLYGLFLGFDDPRVLDSAEFEVDARLLIGHDPNLTHVHFLLEDPACLSGPEEKI